MGKHDVTRSDNNICQQVRLSAGGCQAATNRTHLLAQERIPRHCQLTLLSRSQLQSNNKLSLEMQTGDTGPPLLSLLQTPAE